jgi:hypothetical protein
MGWEVGMGWDGVGWDGKWGWDGMGWDGMGSGDGMGWEVGMEVFFSRTGTYTILSSRRCIFEL